MIRRPKKSSPIPEEELTRVARTMVDSAIEMGKGALDWTKIRGSNPAEVLSIADRIGALILNDSTYDGLRNTATAETLGPVHEVEIVARSYRGIQFNSAESEEIKRYQTYSLYGLLDMSGHQALTEDLITNYGTVEVEDSLNKIEQAIGDDLESSRISNGKAARLLHHLRTARNRLEPKDPWYDHAELKRSTANRPGADTPTAAPLWASTSFTERSQPSNPMLLEVVDALPAKGQPLDKSEYDKQLLRGFTDPEGQIEMVQVNRRRSSIVLHQSGPVSLEIFGGEAGADRINSAKKALQSAFRLRGDRPIENLEMLKTDDDYMWAVVISTECGIRVKFPLFNIIRVESSDASISLAGEEMHDQLHDKPGLTEAIHNLLLGDSPGRSPLSNTEKHSRFLKAYIDQAEKYAQPDNSNLRHTIRFLRQYMWGEGGGEFQTSRDMIEDMLVSLRQKTARNEPKHTERPVLGRSTDLLVASEKTAEYKSRKHQLLVAYDGNRIDEVSHIKNDSWTVYAREQWPGHGSQPSYAPCYQLEMNRLNQIKLFMYPDPAGERIEITAGHELAAVRDALTILLQD